MRAINGTCDHGAIVQDNVEQIVENGFCLFKSVLTDGMLSQLRNATDELLNSYAEENKRQVGNQGSVIAMAYQKPVFQELIALPAALHTLETLGFFSPRYWSAYIIAKEPKSPPTYWHQDWPFWSETVSTDYLPSLLFLMYYLTDTRPENGCLRIIPGSHRRRFPVHEFLAQGHESDLRHQDPDTSPAYAAYPEQVNVPVQAGDLLVGDARLLHATNANRTGERRTVITMWYLPRYEELPDPVRATCQSRLFVPPPATLPPAQLNLIQPFLPNYKGNAEPAEWNREPGALLP